MKLCCLYFLSQCPQHDVDSHWWAVVSCMSSQILLKYLWSTADSWCLLDIAIYSLSCTPRRWIFQILSKENFEFWHFSSHFWLIVLNLSSRPINESMVFNNVYICLLYLVLQFIYCNLYIHDVVTTIDFVLLIKVYFLCYGLHRTTTV